MEPLRRTQFFVRSSSQVLLIPQRDAHYEHMSATIRVGLRVVVGFYGSVSKISASAVHASCVEARVEPVKFDSFSPFLFRTVIKQLLVGISLSGFGPNPGDRSCIGLVPARISEVFYMYDLDVSAHFDFPIRVKFVEVGFVTLLSQRHQGLVYNWRIDVFAELPASLFELSYSVRVDVRSSASHLHFSARLYEFLKRDTNSLRLDMLSLSRNQL